jgi:uncharacterized phiE125 gp8 family phage protein
MSTVSLDEVKAHLNISDSQFDDELSAMIDAAEAILSQSVGPLDVQDAVTVSVAGAGILVLPKAPVAAVSALAAQSVTIDPALYTVDAAAGLIRFADGRSTTSAYLVTYQAGWDELPADIALAVKEMVRHLWRTQRGTSQRPGSSDSSTPQQGYLLPYLVEQLIEPYRLVGVGAA